MADTPEAKVKKKIKEIVSSDGLYSPTYQQGYGKNGTSDSLNCIAGVFVAIEAKSDPSKKPTALQRVYLRKVVMAGGIGCVVDKDNLEELSYLVGLMDREGPGFMARFEVDGHWRLTSAWLDRRSAGWRINGDIPKDVVEKKKQ